METAYGYLDDMKCWFSSDERKTITRIRKLQKEHPDELVVLHEPEDNDGCIVGYCPANWVKLSPPRKYDLTDEQRAKMAENMRNYNLNSANKTKGE